MSTVFGWNLVTMPSYPAPQSVEYSLIDNDGMTISPFNSRQQAYGWGGAHMEANLTYAPQTRAQGAELWAFLMACRGRLNVFQFGDPKASAPRGNPVGNPGLDPDVVQSGIAIQTVGWTPNAQGVLLPGDWFSIGYRLHCVIAQVNADSNGNATIEIWPNVRENPLAWTPIITASPKGLWRLKSSSRRWSQTCDLTYGFNFEILEAL